jgi:hypothetical protein
MSHKLIVVSYSGKSNLFAVILYRQSNISPLAAMTRDSVLTAEQSLQQNA